MTAEEIKEAKTFLAQEPERGVTLPWADEALEHLRTMVIAYEPLLATCERLVKALEDLSDYTYESAIPGGDGKLQKLRAHANAALAEAKKVQNG